MSVTGLWVALIALPLFGQTEAVDLRLHIKSEETLRYTVVQSVQAWLSVDVNGVVRSFLDRESITTRDEHRVTAVDDDGTMSFDVTEQQIKNTASNGPPRQPQHWIERVRPNGEIIQGAGGRGPEYFLIGLPDRAIVPGESWTYKQKGVSGEVTKEARAFLGTDIAFTLTLAGVDQRGGDRIAHVQIRGEGLLDLSAAQSTFSGAIKMEGKSPVRVTGEAIWSIDRGRLVRLKQETSFEVPQEVVVEGRTYQGKGKFLITEAWELVSSPN